MDVRCYICGWALPPEEQAHAVVLKLKGGDDSFIFQHWGCWIEHGRFRHYDIDWGHVFAELEARLYRAKK